MSTSDTLPTKTEHHSTSPFGIPQAESTHQYNDTTNVSMTNSSLSSSSTAINQTIDFGENDPSTMREDTMNTSALN